MFLFLILSLFIYLFISFAHCSVPSPLTPTQCVQSKWNLSGGAVSCTGWLGSGGNLMEVFGWTGWWAKPGRRVLLL